MALDRYMQLVPGYSSNRQLDTLGRRTRKGIDSFLVTDDALATLDVSGFAVIGEIPYAFSTLGLTFPVAPVAGNYIYLRTPVPARLLDPYSYYAKVTSGTRFLSLAHADSFVSNQVTFSAAYSVNKITVYYKGGTNWLVNGAPVTAPAPTAGTTYAGTLITGYTLRIATPATIVAGDYFEVRINPYEYRTLAKTILWTVATSPAGDYVDTKGMLIAGTKVAFRDKSIRLGYTENGTDILTGDPYTEEFHVYGRDVAVGL